MTIPLDNLYDYIFNVATSADKSFKNTEMYYFFPYGSKSFKNLSIYKSDFDDLELNNITKSDVKLSMLYKKSIFCNDQEPLDFDLYQNVEEIKKYIKDSQIRSPTYLDILSKNNIASHPSARCTMYDKNIIIHSEKNSEDLKKYEDNGFIGVFYWSHAIISLDWFRFANYDSNISFYDIESFKKDFNVYCRAWDGTREYRLEVLNKIFSNGIIDFCEIHFNPYDSNHIHFLDYEPDNKKWTIPPEEIENRCSIKQNSASSLSASYAPDDYKNTAIDLVLETVFDQNKIHLTEKIMRPIACGKPFILVAGPESLKFLRSYGFETFGSIIDESYDDIINPQTRLAAVISTVEKITNLPKEKKKILFQEMHEIAERNKKHFFSEKFMNTVLNELTENMNEAVNYLNENCRTGKELKLWTGVCAKGGEIEAKDWGIFTLEELHSLITISKKIVCRN